MTTGQQLDSISTVSNVSALTHLLNPSGDGGTGKDVLIPYTDFECDLAEVILECALYTEVYNANLIATELDAILTTTVHSADVDDKILNGDLGCQL